MNTKGGESGRTLSGVGGSSCHGAEQWGERRGVKVRTHENQWGLGLCTCRERERERERESARDGARGAKGESNTAEGETREPSQSRSRRETALLEGSVCVVVCVNVRKRISQIFSLFTTLAFVITSLALESYRQRRTREIVRRQSIGEERKKKDKNARGKEEKRSWLRVANYPFPLAE